MRRTQTNHAETEVVSEGQARYARHLEDTAEAFERTDKSQISPSPHPSPPSRRPSPEVTGRDLSAHGEVATHTEDSAHSVSARTVKAAAAANGASRLVPDGGLAGHEAAGGHVLARHIGMTDADLLARLASNPRISAASTFNTRAVAESSVAGLLNANAAGVGSWLAGSGSRLVLNGSHGVTGRSVAQGSSSISNVTGVRAVLVRDPNLSVGYRVQTAFPTP